MTLCEMIFIGSIWIDPCVVTAIEDAKLGLRQECRFYFGESYIISEMSQDIDCLTAGIEINKAREKALNLTPPSEQSD